MVLRAELRLVVRWQVTLHHKLVGIMRIGAVAAVLASASHDDVAAHLRLFSHLDLAGEFVALFFRLVRLL